MGANGELLAGGDRERRGEGERAGDGRSARAGSVMPRLGAARGEGRVRAARAVERERAGEAKVRRGAAREQGASEQRVDARGEQDDGNNTGSAVLYGWPTSTTKLGLGYRRKRKGRQSRLTRLSCRR